MIMKAEREVGEGGAALDQARQTRRRGRPRLAGPTAGAGVFSVAGWLTTILRPAGALDEAALRRLRDALGPLPASSDMVIIDLTAAEISSPRAVAMSIRTPALDFERAGRCLLVVGASPDLAGELDRAAVPVVTLAADALSRPAA
jgi:hypothetical protein